MDALDPDVILALALGYWLILAFIIGAAVGSFVNVVVARLPVEKSLLWPSSRCGRCLQPVKWHDNLPLVSYLWLRGRCRSCGQGFSSAYFWIELVTGLGFVGLFYVEVMQNVHGWPVGWGGGLGMFAWTSIAGWAYHAVLFAFLLAASACDLKTREIPLALTLTGTLIGLIGATLMPWPWPWSPDLALPAGALGPNAARAWQLQPFKEGIYPWPFWGPLPEFCGTGGNWQTGLTTGLCGALAGTFLMRGVAFLFGTGLGKEAMGLGDADLMMMAGAFLGWQVVVASFFLSVFPALVVGIFQLVVRGDNSLPFGPSLSLGVLITFLCWGWIGPQFQMFFFHGTWIASLFGLGAGGMLLMSFLMRLMKSEPGPEAQP